MFLGAQPHCCPARRRRRRRRCRRRRVCGLPPPTPTTSPVLSWLIYVRPIFLKSASLVFRRRVLPPFFPPFQLVFFSSGSHQAFFFFIIFLGSKHRRDICSPFTSLEGPTIILRPRLRVHVSTYPSARDCAGGARSRLGARRVFRPPPQTRGPLVTSARNVCQTFSRSLALNYRRFIYLVNFLCTVSRERRTFIIT